MFTAGIIGCGNIAGGYDENLKAPGVYTHAGGFKKSGKIQIKAAAHEHVLLAIVGKESDNYVGNILLGPIDWVNRSAQISIMIGDKTVWGKGYATEAIAMLTEHAFKNLNLHRVFSGTINPGFKKIVCEKLGWDLEGEQKRAIWCDGRYVDVWIMSKLNE